MEMREGENHKREEEKCRQRNEEKGIEEKSSCVEALRTKKAERRGVRGDVEGSKDQGR